mmetsp:Transcript_9337/g.12544  ORF Transcript_9337/g.12544 Transcript_9337/m.12544 type:complete len:408 (-) Transcript_9337:106-1329(-)
MTQEYVASMNVSCVFPSAQMLQNQKLQSKRVMKSSGDADQMTHDTSRINGTQSTIKPVVESKSKRKRNSKKDGLPRRPLTAYNLFFRDQRTKILQDIEKGVHEPEVASDSEGEVENARESFNCEQQGVNKKTDITLENGIESFPSPSSTAFMQLRKPGSKRKRASPHGKISFQSLAKIIGARWKKLERCYVIEYEKLAADDKLRYKKEMAEYKERQVSEEQGAKETHITPQQVGSIGSDEGSDQKLKRATLSSEKDDISPDDTSRDMNEPILNIHFMQSHNNYGNVEMTHSTPQQRFLSNQRKNYLFPLPSEAPEPPHKVARFTTDTVVSAETVASMGKPLTVLSNANHCEPSGQDFFNVTPQQQYMLLAAAVGVMDDDSQLPESSHVFDVEPINVFDIEPINVFGE